MSYKIPIFIINKFANYLRFHTSYFTQSKSIYRIFCNKILQVFAILSMLLLSTFSSMYAKDAEQGLKNSQEKITEANGLIGIPEDDRKIEVFNQDLYVLPYFHVQVGIGAANTEKIAQKHSTITESTIPTFMIGVGFQQQYYMLGINIGYKIQLSYEVGVKSLGENTMAFRSGGAFFQIHAGYKYVLPHINIGYEMLSVGNDFLPSSKEEVIYADKGMAFGYGVTFLLNRYNALELSIRHSKIYGDKPRLLFNYEFRF